jgi:hypothetical protein
MKTIHFINLTTGIEIYPKLLEQGIEPQFIRIQSSHGENKDFIGVLESLDNNLLMNIALGNKCIIYDAGSRKSNGCSRVIWQLIPFIEYTLNRIWYNNEYVKAFNGNMDVTTFYKTKFNEIPKKLRRKISYYKKFLMTDKPIIETYYWLSTTDGNMDIDYRIFIN